MNKSLARAKLIKNATKKPNGDKKKLVQPWNGCDEVEGDIIEK
jgi:hypothetical protein